MNTDDLVAALRACAAGLYPLEAGIELLISNGTFLHRDDFTGKFIDHGISDGTGQHYYVNQEGNLLCTTVDPTKTLLVRLICGTSSVEVTFPQGKLWSPGSKRCGLRLRRFRSLGLSTSSAGLQVGCLISTGELMRKFRQGFLVVRDEAVV